MSRNIDKFIEELRLFNNENVRAIQNDLLLRPLTSSEDRSLVSDDVDDDNEISTGIVQMKLKGSSPEDNLAGASKDQEITTSVVPEIMESLSTDKSLIRWR
jgi:hypothetical protein